MAIITRASTICSSSLSLTTTTHHNHYNQLLQQPFPFSSLPTLCQTSSIGPPTPVVVLDLERAAAEALALATEAAQAAREAMELASVADRKSEKDGLLKNKKKVKSRRRRKRKYLQFEENKNGLGEDRVFDTRPVKKSGFLSSREEAEYCMFLKEGAKIEAARKRILASQSHEPTSDQLAKAIGMNRRKLDKIMCKERESRDKITQSYRGLVVSIATSYQGNGLSLKDLIQVIYRIPCQEGSIGLLHGATKFDPERGCKLSTYVYWWIRQAIIRALTNKSRTVRLSESMYEIVAKMAKTKDVLTRKLQRLPTHDEIAEALNVRVSTIHLASEKGRSVLSLDQVLTERGTMSLQEIIPGPKETIPERMVNQKLLKQDLEKLLETTLSNRESCILKLRFGLNGTMPQSCEQIGELLKLSRERVRQISGAALKKLRKTSNVHDLKMKVIAVSNIDNTLTLN
ncbi:hypothetical protein ACFE04_001849 [Oxalis oulophora]